MYFAVCNAGYYTEAANSTDCTECAQGTYKAAAGNDATACVACSNDGSRTTEAAAKTLASDCSKIHNKMISFYFFGICKVASMGNLVIRFFLFYEYE